MEADKAALVERLNALKRKHELEAKEEELRKEREKLRKEKEQLALETEIAATNAMLNVLEINSKCSSKRSNGMNSYLERNKAQSQMTSQLNPRAQQFVPRGNDTQTNQFVPQGNDKWHAKLISPRGCHCKAKDNITDHQVYGNNTKSNIADKPQTTNQ